MPPQPKPEKQTPDPKPEDRHARRFRILLAVRVLMFVLLTAGFLWFADRRLRELGVRLLRAEDSVEALSRQMERFSGEMESLRERTATAEQQASEAKQKANESAAARRQSELEAERARQESEMTRAELDLLRQKREEELNKMQEALNRVVPTRRTPSGMVIELGSRSFQFDFNKATLRPENRELLSRIAGVLLASKGYSLSVYGHTDDIGTEAYNLDLSERRARSVRDYLVQAGIPAGLITTQGFGKSSPLVKETSREAREKNRRVEIAIVDTLIRYEGEVKGSQSGPGEPKAQANSR